MISSVAKLAAGWAITLFVLSGLLLLIEDPGTPGFVITLFTMCLALILGAGAGLVTLLVRRSQRRGQLE